MLLQEMKKDENWIQARGEERMPVGRSAEECIPWVKQVRSWTLRISKRSLADETGEIEEQGERYRRLFSLVYRWICFTVLPSMLMK